MLESLDPRVNRLQLSNEAPTSQKEGLDQLPTFEVFVQAKEGRPYQHEGIVHASDEEMAFLCAKEQFSRRYTCTGIWIVKTENIHATSFTEDDHSVYDSVEAPSDQDGSMLSYEIFHLLKRGKQHRHAGSVEAANPVAALWEAKNTLDPKQTIYNVWVVPTEQVLMSDEDTRQIWDTLPEKSFRDAISYKAGDKIKEFKARQS
jgi:ring-1,2-phenylacetyl-CoA epoxidase subunit PaaB